MYILFTNIIVIVTDDYVDASSQGWSVGTLFTKAGKQLGIYCQWMSARIYITAMMHKITMLYTRPSLQKMLLSDD